jgi:hypothetical protein
MEFGGCEHTESKDGIFFTLFSPCCVVLQALKRILFRGRSVPFRSVPIEPVDFILGKLASMTNKRVSITHSCRTLTR